MNRLLRTAALIGSTLTVSVAWAHGPAAHAMKESIKKEQQDWGIAGDAAKGLRTIDIRMGDDMRFAPGSLQFREGETVRLRIKNEGAVMHEFVIGTDKALAEHAALMMRFPDMQHDEPYMAHVPPGQTGEIIWTFNRIGSFGFACLINGHFQAGMRGTIVVQPTGKEKS